VHVEAGDSDLWAFPWDTPVVTVIVEFPGTAAGRQGLSCEVSRDLFRTQIAPARTFALETEYASLIGSGLAGGGSPDNAFLIGESGYSGELRFADEVVRHKALDLIGDLLLGGGPLLAHVLAIRPGHASNVRLAAALKESAADEGTEEY
jgi:UDP-3-O-acyl-N-acetylglucosamine deacetylase